MSLGDKLINFSKFQGLKFQFIFYFLIFSFVPLMIFSILGFFLNRMIIEKIYLSNLQQSSIHVSQQIKEYFKAKDQLANSLFVNFGYKKALSDKGLLFEKADISSIYELPKVVIFKDQLKISKEVISEEVIEYLKSTLGKENYFVVIIPGLQIFFKSKLNDQFTLFQSINLKELQLLLDHPDRALNNSLLSRTENFHITADSIKLTDNYQQVSEKKGMLKARQQNINDDLLLLTSKSRAGIDNELKLFLTEILIANFIIGLLMLFSAIFFSRRIISPIDSLVNTVKKFSKGDLNESIVIKGSDELQALADEFEKMRLKLRESYVDLENKIEERTKALRDAQFQISHQEKMASLGLLAAGVAHEIGNPLTSISSMAQIIKRKVKDQNFIEYLNTILKNIERIRKIVRELVDFARPSSYEAADTNINEVIRNAVGIVKYDRRAKSINIELELDNNLPTVFLVSDQLVQVFINILINAVDALSEDKNRIIIRSKKQVRDLIVQFEDEGIGIKPENISKIFEPFYTTKKVGKGTGLGLSVSYGIIKNLNGRIDVQSEFGKGSIFTISLPRTARS